MTPNQPKPINFDTSPPQAKIFRCVFRVFQLNSRILTKIVLKNTPLKCPKIFLRGGIVNWNTPDTNRTSNLQGQPLPDVHVNWTGNWRRKENRPTSSPGIPSARLGTAMAPHSPDPHNFSPPQSFTEKPAQFPNWHDTCCLRGFSNPQIQKQETELLKIG